jgi:transposase
MTRTITWAAERACIRKRGFMQQESATPVFIGIDVGKDRLDVHVHPLRQPFRMPYDENGIARLVTRLGDLNVGLIVLEATGALEVELVAALSQARLPVRVVDGQRVRAFARATGRLAKTDRLDAEVIALFAAQVQPAPATDEDSRAAAS